MNKTSLIAINKWVFFCMNYPHDFIEQVWKDEQWLVNHLRGKFASIYDTYGSRAVMNTFYCELDGSRKQQLMTWVMENYDGEQALRFND